MTSFGPLVSATWLAGHLTDSDLRMIDCRWFYDHDTGIATSGRAAHEAGRIPGSAFVDIDEDLTGTQLGVGRRPPPEREAFQRPVMCPALGYFGSSSPR